VKVGLTDLLPSPPASRRAVEVPIPQHQQILLQRPQPAVGRFLPPGIAAGGRFIRRPLEAKAPLPMRPTFRRSMISC